MLERSCSLASWLFACVLLLASSLHKDLGLPACLASLAVAIVLVVREKTNPLRLVREISWSVLPLVAALFIIVEAVKTAGALSIMHDSFATALRWPIAVTSLAIGSTVGFGTDLVNNLPLGL